MDFKRKWIIFSAQNPPVLSALGDYAGHAAVSLLSCTWCCFSRRQYRSREEERAVRRHGSLQVPSSSQSYVFLDGRIRTDRDGSVVPLLQFYRLLSSIFFFHIALCICKACLDRDLADSLLARQRSQPQMIKIERLGALSGPGSFAEAQTKQPRADG